MNYYNEFDPKAAAWLRELIKRGEIAQGDVDERSIKDVRASDLRWYRQCHFFAGIGGWSLALRLAGVSDDEPLWTGSCPCQPFSVAGKGLGEADERHLWPVFRELIRERGPARVLGEQVASAAGRDWLDGVRLDLEGMGYAVGGADLCAAGIGAPHIRQRLFWMADAGLLRGEHAPFREWRKDNHGPSSGLADAECRPAERHRLELAATSGGVQEASRQQWIRDDARDGRDAGGLADAANDRRERIETPSESNGRPGLAHTSRLGDTIDEGPQRYSGDGDDRNQPGRIDALPAGSTSKAGGDCWSIYDIIPCGDGKARRIEPGLAPLVDGVSARVVRLRGYGNAIVPQLAAAFIVSALEAIEDMNHGTCEMKEG